MITLQQRFMATLDRRTKARGLELVVSYNYSNCGLLHFMRPGGFQETLSIPFDVQPGRVTLGWMGQQGSKEVFPEKSNPRFAQFQAGELDDAIDALLKAAT